MRGLTVFVALLSLSTTTISAGRKPGKCLSRKNEKDCIEKALFECNTDNDCINDRKCCMVACVKRCVNPIPKPYIQVQTNTKTVERHMSVRIGCHVEYQEFEGWYKPNGQRISTLSKTANIRVEKNPKKNEWVLVLTMIEVGGTYICRGAMTKDHFRLRIKYEIGYIRSRKSLNRGRNGLINLETYVTGYPRPQYTWKKDGKPIDMTTGRFTVSPSGSLSIKKVDASDEGQYFLHVKQQDKDDEMIGRKTLVIIEILVVSEICPLPIKDGFCTSQVACTNDTNCNNDQICCFDGCSKRCTGLSWEGVKPGWCPPLRYKTKCSFHDYDNCRKDSDCKGKQKCCRDYCKRQCTETTVTPHSDSYIVAKQSSNEYFNIGQKIIKSCRVNHFEGWYGPSGDMIMEVDGRVFVQFVNPSEAMLVIHNVTAEDGGKYTCYGANEMRSFVVNINVTVVKRPVRLLLRPEKRIPILIRTDIRGYPLPKFIWYRNGNIINSTWKEYTVAPSGSLGIANQRLTKESVVFKLIVEQDGRLYDPNITVTIPSDKIASDTASPSRDTSVECYKSEMQLVIKKEVLENIKVEYLQLRDPKCKPKENATHVILTTPLIGCGTTVRHTSKAVVYSNTVAETSPRGMITRINRIDIPFSCYYANEGITSTLGILPKLVSKFISGTNSSTNFILSMKLYKDKSFSQEFQTKDFPLTVGLNEPLFIEVKIESPDDRLSVLTERCYATPNQNPLDRVTYDVIRKGCPMDPTLQFYESQLARTRFTFNSFQFVGVSQRFVFVHCKLVVCNATDQSSRCSQGCQSSSTQSRLRKSVKGGDYDFTQGPIVVLEEKHSKSERLNGLETTSSIYVWLFIGMAVLCLVCLTSIIYMRRQLARESYIVSEIETRETRL